MASSTASEGAVPKSSSSMRTFTPRSAARNKRSSRTLPTMSLFQMKYCTSRLHSAASARTSRAARASRPSASACRPDWPGCAATCGSTAAANVVPPGSLVCFIAVEDVHSPPLGTSSTECSGCGLLRDVVVRRSVSHVVEVLVTADERRITARHAISAAGFTCPGGDASRKPVEVTIRLCSARSDLPDGGLSSNWRLACVRLAKEITRPRAAMR